MSDWLDWTHHRDLSGRRGNGPFPGGYMHGVVLHVNDSGLNSQGTDPQWFIDGGGPDEVCPNFQILASGETWQFLPMNYQSWCQSNGNSWGPSIETGGDPSQPMTPAQVKSAAAIMRAYHKQYDMPLTVAEHIGQRGLGWHGMGGYSWGGHPYCPGTIRKQQRPAILAVARGVTDPFDELMEQLMSWYKSKAEFESAMTDLMERAVEAKAPLQSFNVDSDGEKHRLGTFLAGIPGYQSPPERRAARKKAGK